MSNRLAFWLAMSLWCLAAGRQVLAVPLEIRQGNEFQVNAFTSGKQYRTAVGMDANGNIVVVWEDNLRDGGLNGIFARRYNAAGDAQAAEFQVNSYTTGLQRSPALAAAGNGTFVVAWTSSGQDGDGGGIFARRFNAAGTPQAAEFQVNSFTAGYQDLAAADADSFGDFAIAWASGRDGDSYGVFARRFSANGTPQASEFQVNVYTSGIQASPAVAVDADGDFVVVWQSYDQDGSNGGVFGRRFKSSGAPSGTEFQINTQTTGDQRASRVAIDSAGDFVVAWQNYNQNGDSYRVVARRFGSSGVATGGEFQVNAYSSDAATKPTIASAADGDFVVAWNSALGSDGDGSGVFARRFDAAGTPLASEFQVNSYTAGAQSDAAVASSRDGALVVAWSSYGQDGHRSGVFGQRFGALAILDIDGNGTVAALTDGLLVLRYLFGFSGTTLTAGAVDLGSCTRCDAAAIEPYLGGLV